MKALLFLILSLNFASAQTDTLEAIKYYPLDAGNYWEYEVLSWEFPYFDIDTTYYSVEVTGDTILSNNNSYKILTREGIPSDGSAISIYERIDTATACLYRYTTNTAFANNEYLCDSLLGEVGDYFTGSYIGNFSWPGDLSTLCTDEYDDSVLNNFTSVKEFDDQSGIPATTYSFAKGMGFMHSLACEFGCGEVFLRYAKIDSLEYGTQITKAEDVKNKVPEDFILYQNYPNPFNPTTKIELAIPHPGFITLKVYDVLGNEIKTLVNEEKPSGRYNIKFDGSNLASGIYFYVLQSGSFIQSRKMLLLK
jgi:hypothetical protein